jgi:hypothetical protein
MSYGTLDAIPSRGHAATTQGDAMLKLWEILEARRSAAAADLRRRQNIAADLRLLALLDESQRRAHEQLFGPPPTPQSIPAGLVLGRASW